MRYSVHLRDSGFDDAARTAAEERYRIKLHRLLGSEREVVETYQQWNALVERDHDANHADRDFVRFWESVAEVCRSSGLKGCVVPEDFDGFFEIRVLR